MPSKPTRRGAGKTKRASRGMPAEPRAPREPGEERPAPSPPSAVGAEPDTRGYGSPGIEETWVHLPGEYWEPEQIHPQPWNPRKPMSATARESLKRGVAFYGLAGGLNVRVEDGMLIGGHQRFSVACELIREHLHEPEWLAQKNMPGGKIPVNPIRGMPDKVAMAFNAMLNNKEAQGEWDMPKLAELASFLDGEGFDATLMGFGTESLEDILTWTPDPGDKLEERDDVDVSVPRVPMAQPGDLYRLGRHRLIVGDATSPAVWDRLLEGKRFDGIFTDPPYGVAYEGGTAEKLTIENDDIDEAALEQLLTQAFACAFERSKPGAAWYVFAPGGPLFNIFGTVLKRLDVWRQTISWVKDRFVLSRQDYHWREEPALVGETPGDEPKEAPDRKLVAESKKKKQPIVYGWKNGRRHYFIEDRTQDTFWTVERPSRNDDHPTMKPVELYRRGFRNSSKAGALWVDAFAGSGTALIAGEQTGRTVYAIEKDPRFADVCVKRWEQLTNQRAERIRLAALPATTAAAE